MFKESSFSPSRREFLKAMGVAAFFVGLGIPASIAAQLEKNFENKEVLPFSFEEGMRRLKDHVWEKKTESAWVFIEKDEKSGWIDIAVQSREVGASIDAAFLSSLGERFDISKIYFVHTHPIGMYDNRLPKTTIEQLKEKKESAFPLPPSSTDVFLAAKYKKWLTEKDLNSEKFRYGVVDPSGVWDYSADLSHPKIEEFFEIPNDMGSAPGFDLEVWLSEWRTRFIKDGGLNKKNFEEFVQLAQNEYGVIFTHRPHY